MITIYKYRVTQALGFWTFHEELPLPAGARILSCGYQDEIGMVVWALVDTDKPIEPRRVLLYMTGQPWTETSNVMPVFIGTIQLPNGTVAHLFEDP